MIRLQSVSKSYGDRCVVDGLSLAVPAGQTLCLIGGSGSGKTTTLRMLNRLVEPDQGLIEIDGRDIRGLDKIRLRRGIGYVIQQIGLLPHLTVARNIALMLEAEGWQPKQISSQVRQLLELVQLDPELASRYPQALSGGQQQRVGVARALALNPRIILLDEPFAALDPITRSQLQDSFLALQRRVGVTAVMVTHDLAEAFKCGDQIALLNQGRLLQLGSPLEILSQPASPYVAEFVSGQASEQLLALPVSKLATALQPGDGWETDAEGGLAWRDPEGRLQRPPQLSPETPLREALKLLLGSPWPGLPIREAGSLRLLCNDAIRRLL